MRGFASDLRDKTVDETPIKLCGVGWREVVGDDDVLLGVGGRIQRRFAKQIANHPPRDILNIHDPLAQVGVVDRFQSLAVFLDDLLEEMLDISMIWLETA